jgi:glyoxylase I family protein
MSYVNVLPSLHVAEFDTVVDWYERLFGREPDRRPMESSAEWQLADSGGLQLFNNPAHPVQSTVILGVDDLAVTLADIATRGINTRSYDVPSGFRLAELHDPAGNLIVMTQSVPQTP